MTITHIDSPGATLTGTIALNLKDTRYYDRALGSGPVTLRFDRGEALVVEPLLEHIGLPWEDACLAYYNNQRPVRTASLAQVRQPVYQTSVGGWQHYRTQLQPLLDIVGDYR